MTLLAVKAIIRLNTHTHTRTHARTHAHTHTHARTHTHKAFFFSPLLFLCFSSSFFCFFVSPPSSPPRYTFSTVVRPIFTSRNLQSLKLRQLIISFHKLSTRIDVIDESVPHPNPTAPIPWTYVRLMCPIHTRRTVQLLSVRAST